MHKQSTTISKEHLLKHLQEDHHKTPLAQYLKEVVYGGIDGIITTFAVVAGFTGAAALGEGSSLHLPVVAILIFGLANLLADGFAMGTGEFLSARSEKKLYVKEYARERHEIDNNPEFEAAESRLLFEQKGFSPEDAQKLVDLYRKNPTYWTEFMMRYELEMPMPDRSPLRNALATFGAFVLFGSSPLIPYLFVGHHHYIFLFSALSAIGALAILGMLRARITQEWAVKSMVEIIGLGVFAGGIAYAVGLLLR